MKNWFVKKALPLFLLCAMVLSVAPWAEVVQAAENDDVGVEDPVAYVDPMIGTSNFKGNSEFAGLAPFVTTPFGMTNFTPQTRENRIGGISYTYEDNSITGFMASHQPAIWMGDYGYVNVMPQQGDAVKTKVNDRKLPFDRKNEESTPYYYKVQMDKSENESITTELTATERSAIFNFDFTADNDYTRENGAHILVEAARDRGTGYAKIDVDNQEIVGYNTDNMSSHLNDKPPQNLKGYYVIQFSAPFTAEGTYSNYALDTTGAMEVTGKAAGAYVSFDVRRNTRVQMKIGTSFLSIEQARENLEREIPDWDFERVKANLRETWNEKLKTIDIFGATEDEKHIFYTGMYHALLYPRMFYEETAEGPKYFSPYDDTVHSGKSYTDYSIWDTFRAENSLLTLVAPERVDDMVQSLLQNYQEGGYMPKWPNPGYTNIMIGTHADSVVAEAIQKGFTGFDYDLAYQAVYKDAIVPPEKDLERSWGDRATGVPYEARGGLTYYKALGYVPNGKTAENVSRTLEFAYDDWCVAQVAKAIGKDSDYEFFMNRSLNYKNAIDPVSKIAKGRDIDGNWGGGGYTEGNDIKYTWFALHDPQGLMDLQGKEFYNTRLQQVFDNNELEHANEPSHHYAYMFNFSGRPDLAQKYARKTLVESYSNDMAGMLGNDDCGQMSAWYIFSAMGFYPLNPASGEYMIGSPIFDKVVIHNPRGGKDFTITAQNNQDDANMYIQSATLNGAALDVPVLTYEDIIGGGTVDFVMGSTPSDWAKDYSVDALVPNPNAVNPEEGYVPYIGDARISQVNLAKTSTIDATAYAKKDGDIDVPNVSLKDGRLDVGYYVEKQHVGPNYYITFDWATPQALDQISIWSNYPKDQGPTNIDVEVLRGKDWVPVVQGFTPAWKTNQEAAEEAAITFPRQNEVTSLRLRISDCNSAWGKLAIREIEVFSQAVQYKDAPSDIAYQLVPLLNELEEVLVNGTALPAELYSLDENNLLTIKAGAFEAVGAGTDAVVTFRFNAGEDCTAKVRVEATADTKARQDLKVALAEAAKLDENLYTGNSWAALQTALGEAQTVCDDELAGDDAYLAELDKVKNAVAALVERADNTYLATLVETCTNGLVQGQYTPESWAVYATKLAKAKAMVANINATPADVMVAYIELSAAVDQLVLGVDKSALAGLVALADATDTTDCVPASLPALEAALLAADIVLANSAVTQDDVDTAYANLLAALNALREKANIAMLTTLAQHAATLTEGNYTPGSFAPFATALATAQSVLANPNAYQEDVDAAFDALLAAINGLTRRANNAALLKVIEAARAILAAKDKYIASTLTGLDTALATAEGIAGSADSSQAQIDGQTTALNALLAKVRLKPNKEVLKSLYTRAVSVPLSQYTEVSANTLKSAMATANAALKSEDADQDKVDKEAAALKKALDSLQRKPTPPPPAPPAPVTPVTPPPAGAVDPDRETPTGNDDGAPAPDATTPEDGGPTVSESILAQIAEDEKKAAQEAEVISPAGTPEGAPQSNSLNPILWVVLGIAGVALVAFILYFLLAKRKSEEKE